MRRAARYLAISSKKSMWALKKNDSRGANSSTARPRSSACSTYVKPSLSVNASSCCAVEPASRMWYPEIEIGCQRGMLSEHHSTMSVTRRLADADVEREQDRGRPVDRHRGRYLAERDAGEQVEHVVERVDRHALDADLAEAAVL